MEEQDFLEEPLVVALSNMKYITNYNVELYPLTEQIQNIMDATGIKLKKLGLVSLNAAQLVHLFQDSTSALTLEELELGEFDYFINMWIITRALEDSKLDYLTHITVHDERRLWVFVAVLQNLTHLQSLTWNGFAIMNANRRVLDNLDENNIKKSALKSLSVGVFSIYEDYSSIIRINHIFSSILKSCPVLEQFKLSGGITGRQPGVLDLDFLSHAEMKLIKICFRGCKYYTFNGNEARWRCYGGSQPIGQDYNQQDDCFHIHLKYKSRIKV